MYKNVFRRFIVANWLLTLLALIFSFTAEDLLPSELRNYLDASREVAKTAPVMAGEWLLIAVYLMLCVVCLVAWVGLFFFKKWARLLSTISLVPGLLLLPAVVEANVTTSWEMALSILNNMLYGATLALAYFSPVSQLFETKDSNLRESSTGN